MGRIGPAELAILAAIALVLFGGSRISELGRGMGEAIRNFKRGLQEDDAPDASQPSVVAVLPSAGRANGSVAVSSGVESPPVG